MKVTLEELLPAAIVIAVVIVFVLWFQSDTFSTAVTNFFTSLISRATTLFAAPATP